MADIWDSEKRSDVMSRIKSRRNKSTELKLVSLFRERGITGWRRQLPLTGKPDFAFPKPRVVVFVDGCFWHGCPKCYRRPKSNRRFWDDKVRKNRLRDLRVGRELRRKGWSVIRVWEHCLRKPEATLRRIIRKLQERG